MPTIPYITKLKDPRWQRKRLEILARDQFACLLCSDCESTLHVHHCFYQKGLEPWEYPDLSLKTLCETCHEAETRELGNAKKAFLDAFSSQGCGVMEFTMLAEAVKTGHAKFFENEPATIALAHIFVDKTIADAVERYYYQVGYMHKNG